MLRLTEVKLSLDHAEDDLPAAIVKRLGIALEDLLNYTIFRRAIDARKRSTIHFIYTLDVEVAESRPDQSMIMVSRSDIASSFLISMRSLEC